MLSEAELDALRESSPLINGSLCRVLQHVWVWMGGNTATSTPEPWRRCSCSRYRWDDNTDSRVVVTGWQGERAR